MPDRYGDPDEQSEALAPDDIWAAEQRATTVVNCGLCDDEGYRGSVVCDHVDHAAQTQHGRALVRAELEKIAQRKVNHAP